MHDTDTSDERSQSVADQLLGHIPGHEDHFPWKTSARFPQIVEKIAELWPNATAMRAYFEQLLLTERETRQGFPQEIYTEIDSLSDLYNKLHPAGEKSKDDFWSWV